MYNFLATLKKQVFGKSNISLGELAGWCEDNYSVPDPILPDEPFVCNYQMFIDVDEEDNLPLDYEKGDLFRFS